MNWQIIVGVFFLIGGIGNLTKDFGAFLFGSIIGAVLLIFGFKKRKLKKENQATPKTGHDNIHAHFMTAKSDATDLVSNISSLVEKKRSEKDIPIEAKNYETSHTDSSPKLFQASKGIPTHDSTSLHGDYYLAYHYDDVKFYPPFEVVSKLNKKLLHAGATVILKPEPRNKYDNRAVALYVSGHKIGYLLRGTLQDMANDYIAKEWPIKATLISLKLVGGEYQGYITLSFYRKAEERSPKRLGYHDIDIHSIRPTSPESRPNTPLSGKNIVFSGYFSIPIDSVMQIAVDAGATLKSRVTKNTDYLVVGIQDQSFLDENGLSSKEATATKLNQHGEADIKIIDEKTFLGLTTATQTTS